MKLPAWSHDGKWIYFISDFTLGHRMYRCSTQGGPAELLPTPVHATRPAESSDGQYLFVTSREVDFDLGKISLKGPKAGVQTEGIARVLNWTLWRLTANGVYFVATEAPRTMRFYDFATRTTKDVFSLEKDFDDGISVSPDGRYMLYSQVDAVNSDVMVMDKYH